jgi:hypothetical protein
MISEFSFESSSSFTEESVQARQPVAIYSGLQLPLTLPGELLNLDGVEETVSATIEHFAGLELLWVIEATSGGGSRATAVLAADPLTSAVWALIVLENSSTGPHQHNEGGTYGECVITLAGELDDVLDDGTAVKLGRGAVMFHAPSTNHDATAPRFWVGLYHQPRGCTPLM